MTFNTRTARRLAIAIVVASLAGCADNSVSGIDGQPLLARGSGGGGTATRIEIALTAPAGAPYRAAKGKAKFDSRTPRELQVEAENIPAGTTVVFRLGGTQIGTGTASALGAVRLDLVGAVAPTSVAGKSVTVNRASDGAVIVSGSF